MSAIAGGSPAGIASQDLAKVLAQLQAGIASAEHAAFVESLRD